MANIKVSEMPETTAANIDDLIMIIQGGGNKKITEKNLLGDSIVVSPTEPVENNRKKVWFRWSNNLLDKSKFIFNKSLNVDTGTVNVSTSGNWYAIEEYIYFKQYAGKTISLSNRLTVAFYDSNKKYISSIIALTTPTGIVPTNAVYIRADVYKDYYDVVQLEIGNTPTEYQPYVEPQIFIKNANEIYEEFIKKQEDIYSTEEKKTNKVWIDGKPIYRKVITASINANTTDNVISIADIPYDIIMINYGESYNAWDTNTTSSLNWYSSATDGGLCWVNSDKEIRIINNSVTNRTYVITLEYTKK